MVFRYRSQRVQQLRERKKEEQERRVQKARERVRQIQRAIEAKKQEIKQVRHSMMTSSHMLLDTHDKYLEKLNIELQQLQQDLIAAEEQLKIEMDKLIVAQAELEAILKHRQRQLEEYNEEEKQRELKLMDEIGGQRFFRTKEAADKLDKEEAEAAWEASEELLQAEEV